MKGFLNFLYAFAMALFVTEQRTLVLHIGANDYENFLDTCGDERTPGIAQTIYAFPASEVATWPDLVATTGIGEPITYDGNITLVSTPVGVGYMRKFKAVVDSGQVMSELVGEPGSKAWKNTAKFKFPGTSVEMRDHIRRICKNCNIFLIESREVPGKYMVLGTPSSPCLIDEAKMDTGTTVGTGTTGWALTIRDTSGLAIRQYEGTLDLTPNV